MLLLRSAFWKVLHQSLNPKSPCPCLEMSFDDGIIHRPQNHPNTLALWSWLEARKSDAYVLACWTGHSPFHSRLVSLSSRSQIQRCTYTYRGSWPRGSRPQPLLRPRWTGKRGGGQETGAVRSGLLMQIWKIILLLSRLDGATNDWQERARSSSTTIYFMFQSSLIWLNLECEWRKNWNRVKAWRTATFCRGIESRAREMIERRRHFHCFFYFLMCLWVLKSEPERHFSSRGAIYFLGTNLERAELNADSHATYFPVRERHDQNEQLPPSFHIEKWSSNGIFVSFRRPTEAHWLHRPRLFRRPRLRLFLEPPKKKPTRRMVHPPQSTRKKTSLVSSNVTNSSKRPWWKWSNSKKHLLISRLNPWIVTI